MQVEINNGEISGASLRLLSIGLHILAHAAPSVYLIRQIDRQDEIVEGQTIKRGGLRPDGCSNTSRVAPRAWRLMSDSNRHECSAVLLETPDTARRPLLSSDSKH